MIAAATVIAGTFADVVTVIANANAKIMDVMTGIIYDYVKVVRSVDSEVDTVSVNKGQNRLFVVMELVTND